jgi:cytochrome c-type biogenesis protein CcmE
MNRKHKKKLFGITLLLMLLALASSLVLYALKQNINLFYTPTQLLEAKEKINPQQNLRLGGFVQKHSVQYDASGQQVEFTITDQHNQIQITYQGVLPNLFREGQGVVVTGKLLDTHHLAASEVLAKHDEKYIPRPLAESLQTKT